jgi:hypothetical protein
MATDSAAHPVGITESPGLYRPRELEKSRAKPKTSGAGECQNAGKTRQTADHYQLLFLRQMPSRWHALANHHSAVALPYREAWGLLGAAGRCSRCQLVLRDRAAAGSL